MPRLQIYLSEALYKELKTRHLPASELLQNAVRAEVLRQDRELAADRYARELEKEVGKPRAKDLKRAAETVNRISHRRLRRAG